MFFKVYMRCQDIPELHCWLFLLSCGLCPCLHERRGKLSSLNLDLLTSSKKIKSCRFGYVLSFPPKRWSITKRGEMRIRISSYSVLNRKWRLKSCDVNYISSEKTSRNKWFLLKKKTSKMHDYMTRDWVSKY